MEDLQLYEELVRHLDHGIIGSPKSSALIEILKILFPVEEAEIAVNLPMQNKTLSELKEIVPEKADCLEEILKEANEEGLVHIIDNVEGYMSTICSCCGCCCVFLDTQKKMGLHTLSSSNYVSEVDVDKCVGCATCEERCPMEAIAVTVDGIAEVSESTCIGCGVCTPTCSNEAVDFVQRTQVKAPPDSREFMTKRYKEA